MPEISVDFRTYMPTVGVVFSYFAVLQMHGFVGEITVVSVEGKNVISVKGVCEKEKMGSPEYVG